MQTTTRRYKACGLESQKQQRASLKNTIPTCCYKSWVWPESTNACRTEDWQSSGEGENQYNYQNRYSDDDKSKNNWPSGPLHPHRGWVYSQPEGRQHQDTYEPYHRQLRRGNPNKTFISFI